MGGERMSLGLGVREVDLRSEQSWAGPEACMEAVGGRDTAASACGLCSRQGEQLILRLARSLVLSTVALSVLRSP